MSDKIRERAERAALKAGGGCGCSETWCEDTLALAAEIEAALRETVGEVEARLREVEVKLHQSREVEGGAQTRVKDLEADVRMLREALAAREQHTGRCMASEGQRCICREQEAAH